MPRSGRREEEQTLYPRSLLIISALVMLVAAAACGDGGAKPGSTSTPSSTPPAEPDAIRHVDLTRQQDVQAELSKLGSGEVAKNEVAYADLTGDQVEEAIVPITSGGTMGNIAYVVLTPSPNGGASTVLTRNLDPRSPSGLTMSVENGALVEYVGEYGAEDPMCCPSVLRRTTFKWDGSRLQAAGEERVQRPQKGQ